MKRITVTAIAAGLLSGCWYPADRGRVIEDRIDKLSDDNKRLEKELAESKVQQQETVAQVQKALESIEKASRRSDADIGVQLQKTVEDVAALRGQVETYQYKVGELEQALGKATDELQKKANDANAAKELEAQKKAEALKRPEDPKELFKLADEKAAAGEFPLARQLFNELLKKWPKDALAGEAHYGIGETFHSEDRCREALYEYGKVIQDFAKSKSAPQAYLRSSECFKKLKMTAESKLALEELTKQFPKSDAAKTAKQRLAELPKEKEKKK